MKRFIAIGVAALALIALVGCPAPVGPGATKSSEKEVMSFAFLDTPNDALSQDFPAGYVPIGSYWYVGPLPAGTNLSALVATFELSAGASLSVGGVPQTSGVTANDFSADVTYVITAEDGSTATFDVQVESTEMGFTSVDFLGVSLLTAGEASVVITDTTTPRTVVAHIPGHAASEIGALKADIEHNGLSVTVGGIAHDDATSTYDFANSETTPLEFTLNGQAGVTELYNVTVIADPVGTAATLDSFSIEVDGITYEGTIDDSVTPGTVAVSVPSGTVVTSLVASFTSPAWSTVTVGSMPMIPQESGVTANDFSAPVTYTVTAEDGTTAKEYTVTVTPNPVFAIITQACPSFSSTYALAGETWFDIKIPNKAALGAGWKIYTANNKTVNLVMSDTDLFTNFADGDTVRIIESSYSGSVNAIGDARPADGLWVFKSAMSTILSSYGTVWIELADGTVADHLSYTSQYNTSGYWLQTTTTWYPTATSPDAPTRLAEAVADTQWLPGDLAAAASLPDSTNYVLRLKDPSKDGNQASDWETYQPPILVLRNATSTPGVAKVTASMSATIVLTAEVVLYGGASAPTTVSADLSALGGTAADALVDDGTNGDAIAGDGIYSLSHIIPAGTIADTYSVTISTTGSANPASQSISIMITPGTVLIHTGFETADIEDPISITGGDFTMDGETWSAVSVYINTTAKVSGTYGMGYNAISDSLTTPFKADPGVFSFTGRASGTSSNFTITLQISDDGSVWTDLTTWSANGTNTGTVVSTNTNYSYTINQLGMKKLRLVMTARSGGSFYFDDLMLLQYEP
ncbi:MAG: hypothetical protein JW923_06620 [Spirochaetales bacterium]|nr:hypothetical protein [Spirochaetales bacterium]MBN2875671.1 hypothetical protein [Spirochaetales bacterium]